MESVGYKGYIVKSKIADFSCFQLKEKNVNSIDQKSTWLHPCQDNMEGYLQNSNCKDPS